MSSVYVLEPPTRGKIVLNSNVGPLDMELWPKEAPKAVRNFVQLCIEGYYNNTIFHRIIKAFMVQGGDPTGTGTGGESIYGGTFADEIHSRLRFNHRGLVASANAGVPNSNNSQFFMTLDRCDWLDRKHTIFGKITGDTIYNLLKLGDTEVDKDDRPVDPVPKILSVEVIWNPFEDIIPRQLQERDDIAATEETLKEHKKKKVKQLNLLSFGEEAEQEEQELAVFNVKIKSSHDVLDDPRLLRGEPESAELDPLEAKRRKELQVSVREALMSKRTKNLEMEKPESFEGGEIGSDMEDEANFDSRMRRQVLEKRKHLTEEKGTTNNGRSGKAKDLEKGASPTGEEGEKVVKREKLLLKKKGLGSEARADLLSKVDVDAQLLGPLEQKRQMYKQKRRTLRGREETTLEKLEKFKNILHKAKEIQVSNSGAAKDETDDEAGWLTYRLEFVSDSGKKDDMAKDNDPNQYVVHDPLLEKGKEKFNKLQAKIKRKEREWAGKSLF